MHWGDHPGPWGAIRARSPQFPEAGPSARLPGRPQECGGAYKWWGREGPELGATVDPESRGWARAQPICLVDSFGPRLYGEFWKA